jgi:superfamily II DNA helicase RecQ
MQQYLEKLSKLDNPTFQQIRCIAWECISHLPKSKRDELYKKLAHGVILLDTHELMCQYLHSFGNMHEAKIKKALSCFPNDLFNKDYDVIDWGCGQGLATICLFDYLKNKGIISQAQNIVLIEPSQVALERAKLHVKAYCKDDRKIRIQNKFIDEATIDDIRLDGSRPVFHLFSNILDIKEINLKKLAIKIDQSVLSESYLICVGPLNAGNRRIDAFYDHFNSPSVFLSDSQSQFEYGGKTTCTYNIKVYKLTVDTEGIVIPVEYFPSVQFHAGYQLDCVKDKLGKLNETEKEKIDNLYSSLTRFETSTPFDIGASVYDDVHPILAVLNNIITRGLPTKASPFIEREFIKAFDLTSESQDEGVISFNLGADKLNANDLFLAMHLIDSRLVLDQKSYNCKILDSDLEKKYITEVEDKIIRQLLQPQRSLSSITKNNKEHFAQRVDFSIEFPYVVKDDSGKGKQGIVVELDGEKYHIKESQKLSDQNRDNILQNIKWTSIRISEADISRKRINYSDSSYLQNIVKASKKSYDSEWTRILQFILTPIAVARVQKTVLEALMTGKLDLSQPEWSVLVDEKDVPCAALAFDDMEMMFNNLTKLSADYQNLKFPHIKLDIISTIEFSNSSLHLNHTPSVGANPNHLKTEYDLVIDVSVLRRSEIEEISFTRFKSKNNCYFNIRSSNYQRSVRSIYTSDKIQYRNLVEKDLQGRYLEIQETKDYLQYFMQLVFRKVDFRPGQLPILSRALQNKGVIGLLPTGGGKSLTYQLAALLQPGVTIVVDPLRSLMKDQFDGLISSGIDCCTFINSTLSAAENDKREKKMESSELLFIFLSPERLCIYRFRERLKNMHELNVYFSYGVIDEVHCVSEWGHDFRFSYLHLGRNLYKYVRTKHGDITLFGLTATASFDVLADVERELSGNGAFELDADTVVRYENTNRLELQYKIEKVRPVLEVDGYFDKNNKLDKGLPKAVKLTDKWSFFDSKQSLLKDYIQEIPKFLSELQSVDSIDTIKNNFSERQENDKTINNDLRVEMPNDYFSKKDKYPHAGIVFCPHKENTGVSVESNKRNLMGLIPDIGYFVGSSGGEKEETEKIDQESNLNLELFRDSKLAVMVATKAFGMGIDKPNVRFTVNMNYSSSLEGFVQEAGRAGRDRKMALSVILLSDYKLVRINKDCPVNKFPMMILKNKWFYPEHLETILDHYNLAIEEQYIDICTPENDMVKLRCECARFAWNSCGGKCSFVGCQNRNKSCETICSKYENCILKTVPKEAKGFLYEKDLLEILRNSNIVIGKRYYQYLNADYDSVMYFYNNNFKGYDVEKDVLHRIMSVQNTQVFQGDDKEIKIDELKSVSGFLTALVKSEPGTELVSFISYNQNDNDGNSEGNKSDIAKAIYRLSCIELIEDFTEDYRNSRYRIVAKRKRDGEYNHGLKNFLIRYYTKDRAEQEMDKVHKYELNLVYETEVEKEIFRCLGYLTEFVYEKIAMKRKRAIDDMRKFCIEGINETKDWKEINEDLKDFLYYYFNSKYAKDDYVADNGELYSLTIDTERGKKSSVEVLKKYMKVIERDLVGIGTPKDNVKHLQGAVRLIRRSLTDDNPALALLNAFCLFYLGTSNNVNLKKEILNSYKEGMVGFGAEMEDSPEFWNLFDYYNGIIREFADPAQLTHLGEEVMITIHGNNLKKITDKYLHNG